MFKLLLATLLAFAAPVQAFAEATIPTKDIAGARDNPLIKRYDGSFIVSYERLAFTDFKVPLSPLEAARRPRPHEQPAAPAARRRPRSRARAPASPICCRRTARRWKC